MKPLDLDELARAFEENDPYRSRQERPCDYGSRPEAHLNDAADEIYLAAVEAIPELLARARRLVEAERLLVKVLAQVGDMQRGDCWSSKDTAVVNEARAFLSTDTTDTKEKP